MSHFTVMVIGPDPEGQLEPFNENHDTPRYIKYTKEELIAKGRKDIEDYKNGTYSEFLADPDVYKRNCKNESHINYLQNEFPSKLTWTDDQVYADEIRWEKAEDIGANGEVYSTYNPKSKWDWYTLGGRWRGFFKLKEGAVGELGDPSLIPRPVGAGTADRLLKSAIDIGGMRKSAQDAAASRYDEVMAKCAGTEPNSSWESILGSHKNTDEARKKYWEQPRCAALQGHIGFGDSPDSFLISREEYIQKESRWPIKTFAVLKDGEWYEKGDMGWWGMVSNRKDEDSWYGELNKLFEELPDDTLISIYDCHI